MLSHPQRERRSKPLFLSSDILSTKQAVGISPHSDGSSVCLFWHWNSTVCFCPNPLEICSYLFLLWALRFYVFRHTSPDYNYKPSLCRQQSASGTTYIYWPPHVTDAQPTKQNHETHRSRHTLIITWINLFVSSLDKFCTMRTLMRYTKG